MATLDTELDLPLARKDNFARNASAGNLGLAPDEPLYIAVRFTGEIAMFQKSFTKYYTDKGPEQLFVLKATGKCIGISWARKRCAGPFE